jgi:hypothetical protein
LSRPIPTCTVVGIDEDDLDVLVRRVDALPAGTEVRRVASTEARRLRRIPPQNHGVARNYVRASVFFLYPTYHV